MQQRDSDPGAMLADKGYDSDAIRNDLLDSGTTPAGESHLEFPRAICKTIGPYVGISFRRRNLW
jgi:hypothetical protein